MAIIADSLKNLSSHVSFILTATNIGVIAFKDKNGTPNIYLIDSGNDDSAASEVLNLLRTTYKDFNLKALLNTHSHADHCGGNTYFVNETNCQIWTTKGEASLMQYPSIESDLIWGGTPVHQIQSPYLMAKPCRADRTFNGEETIELETKDGIITIKVISLPGHYMDQAGFLITDTDGKKSLFMGDAISGRNVIRKYWIQYLLDETNTKRSLEKLAAIKADFYVPGHGHLVDNIEGLSELNLIAILETEDMIIDELRTPKTNDQILKAVADRNSITLGLTNYVLIGSTLRSYLSGLYEEGKITFEITDNMLYWKKAE